MPRWSDGPAVSLARSRSVSRPRAAFRHRFRACARAARAAHRPVPAGRRFRGVRSSRAQRAGAPGQTRHHPDAGSGHLTDRPRRSSGGGGLHTPGSGRRDTANSASAAASSTSSRPVRASRSGSSSSATRSSRSAATIPRPSGRPPDWIRRPSPRCRNCSATVTRPTGRRRRSTTCGRTAGRRCSFPSRRTSTAHGEKLTQQILASYDEAVAKGNRARGVRQSWCVTWDDAADGSTARPLSRRWRSTRRRTLRVSRRCEFAGRVPDWVAEIRTARQAGDTIVFVANSPGPRRAHHRAARRLRDPRRADRAKRRTSRTRIGARRDGPPLARLQPARKPASSSLPRPTSSKKSGTTHERPPVGDADVPLRFPRSQGRRPRRPRRPRHRRVRRAEAASTSAPAPQEFMELRYAGEDKLFVPVERLDLVQKYTGGAEAGARQARRHDLGEGQDARQEGHARHGRGAAQALRRAQGGAGPRVQPRLALAAGIRGRLRVRPHAGPADGHRRHQGATWSRRRRWIACSAATSATARPKSRCARRSRR